MKLSEVQSAVAEGAGVSKKDASAMLETLTSTIAATLKDGGKIQIPGLGIFSASKRAAKKGRNPRTGEEIEIKAANRVTFKPAKPLVDALNPAE